MNKNIFRTYDIRGIASSNDPEEIQINKKNTLLLGKAIGTYLKDKYKAKSIAVGADCRLTSPDLKAALMQGLNETGLSTIDIGLSTSPMLYWSIHHLNLDAGINVTASHNPKDYNGFKIAGPKAKGICGNEIQDIYQILKSEEFDTTKTAGNSSTQDIWPAYLKELKSKIKLAKPLKVVVDCGNGATGPYAPELLREIGAEVIELFTEPDGNFPNHEANPEKLENMEELVDKVLENKADLGIGFDGDGDRIGIIDEKGYLYASDYIVLLLAKDLTTRQLNPKVVFDTKFSQAIINEIERIGAIPVMYKTGHSLIKEKMKEIDAPLAGEVSGHIFFAEDYYGFDDAFLAAIKILEILSNTKKPFSALFDKVEKTYTTEEIKAHCPDDKKVRVVEKLVDYFTQHYDCITIDGVRIKFDEISWALIRNSNTSPNLTLRFEAKSEEQLQEIMKVVYEQLKKYHEVDTRNLLRKFPTSE